MTKSHFLMRTLGAVIAPVVACLVAGCARVPSIDVDGSFLPSWMLCIAAGVVVALAAHAYVLRRKLQPRVAPSVLFYPALGVSVACLLWLLLFR